MTNLTRAVWMTAFILSIVAVFQTVAFVKEVLKVPQPIVASGPYEVRECGSLEDSQCQLTGNIIYGPWKGKRTVHVWGNRATGTVDLQSRLNDTDPWVTGATVANPSATGELWSAPPRQIRVVANVVDGAVTAVAE